METVRLNSFTKEESKENILQRAKSLKQGIDLFKASLDKAKKQQKPVIATYMETGEQVEIESVRKASKKLHCNAHYALKTGKEIKGYKLSYKERTA
ncbi:hypothetical protein ACFIU9_08255 [Oenococcus oeni]|uniref:hypothetical protein n=1 Tax=Oenococcus oeni TaxID=1247 RepID=UPI00050DB558|nr:hypothetical protein [Oenococcus oeni]KGH55248.1 hypothetical protein X463_07750 [Oenococcus oeni S22]PDH93855.1 hypothetical protein AO468_04480 [Oenococcus oeni]